MLRIFFKILNIKYPVRKIRLNEDVQIQIHVAQSLAVKSGWYVNVAVIVSQATIWLREPKIVVPAIQPVVFKTVCAARNRSQQIMNDLVWELGIENDKRTFLL